MSAWQGFMQWQMIFWILGLAFAFSVDRDFREFMRIREFRVIVLAVVGLLIVSVAILNWSWAWR